MSSAPPEWDLSEFSDTGLLQSEEATQNIESIRVHETLIERVAIAFAVVNYVHYSNEIHVHSKYGTKGRLVKASHEVCDLLEFIPGFDSRIEPGRRTSDILWRLPASIAGSVSWISNSTLRQYLGTVLFVIHNDDKLHVEPQLDMETGNCLEVPQHEETSPGINCQVENGTSPIPTNAAACVQLEADLQLKCSASALHTPEYNPGVVGNSHVDLRTLVSRSANTRSSPLGESIALDAMRARKILAFPVNVHRDVSTFKEWIHSGSDRPPTIGGERFHLQLPEEVVISKQCLDNLARLFVQGLPPGSTRRSRLINTDEFLLAEEGDPGPHRYALRFDGRLVK